MRNGSYSGLLVLQIKSLIAAIRSEFASIKESFDKGVTEISSKIESATAEYKAENSKQKGGPELHAVLQRPDSEVQQENARETRKEEHDRRAEDRDSTRLRVEILALTVGSIVAAANIGLWIETHRSVTVSSMAARAAQEGAKASEQQVEATRASIDQTVKSFQLDQRAWIGVTDVSIKYLVLAGHKFVYIGYITNSGKTPSLKTTLLVNYRTGLGSKPPEFLYPPLTEPKGNFVIQPGVKFSFGGHERPSDPTLTQIQIDALKNLTTRMYIYGKIDYFDVFDRHHTTHWCVWLDADLETTHPCDVYSDAN